MYRDESFRHLFWQHMLWQLEATALVLGQPMSAHYWIDDAMTKLELQFGFRHNWRQQQMVEEQILTISLHIRGIKFKFAKWCHLCVFLLLKVKVKNLITFNFPCSRYSLQSSLSDCVIHSCSSLDQRPRLLFIWIYSQDFAVTAALRSRTPDLCLRTHAASILRGPTPSEGRLLLLSPWILNLTGLKGHYVVYHKFTYLRRNKTKHVFVFHFEVFHKLWVLHTVRDKIFPCLLSMLCICMYKFLSVWAFIWRMFSVQSVDRNFKLGRIEDSR